MKNLIIALFVLALGVGLTGRAYAATEASTLDVTATMIASCTVATTSVAFPDTIAGDSVGASGDVTVNCTSGAPYNIALDYGSNFGLDSSYTFYRAIADGAGNYIAYALFKPNDAISEWGDSDQASSTYSLGTSVADTGDGTAQPHRVGAAMTPSSVPGAYTDVVNVTVYY